MPLLSGRRIAVVDVETTGIGPQFGHRVIEVAVVRLDDGEIREHWSSLVAPGRSVPDDAAAVHGITDAMLRDAPPAAVVAGELRRRCDADALGFHHAAFDLPFVHALMRDGGGPPLHLPVVDTLGLSRALFDGRHALATLAERFQFPHEPSHRALGDAMTTARLLQALSLRWEQERGVASLDELAAASQDALRAAASNHAGAADDAPSVDTPRGLPIMEDLFRPVSGPTPKE